jgi:integrase/recombinase XerC
MTTLVPITTKHITVNDDYNSAVRYTLSNVAASSARIYQDTFDRWRAWAGGQGIAPIDVTYANVHSYLETINGTKATKQRILSALRRLASMIAIATGDNRHYLALKEMKVKQADSTNERSGVVLSEDQIADAFNAWRGDKAVQVRNRAILGLIFYTGARRASIAALKWSDVDLDNGVVSYRHAKGDKTIDAAIVGSKAIQALKMWKTLQSSLWGNPTHVFVEMSKSGKIIDDKAVHPDTIWRVVKATGKRINVEFAPHDGRRTFITAGLSNGTPIHEMSEQVGHVNKATTLSYAKAGEAKQRRAKIKLGY